MNDKETWKALDLYHIAVSDKGRIMYDGQIYEALPPHSRHCDRWYFTFKYKGKNVCRDAAIVMWRAFRSKVIHADESILFKDGDMSNLTLENLESIRENTGMIISFEEMKARVPLAIEGLIERCSKN